MRALVFLAPGQVEWSERPQPRLDGAAQALVRPLAVALCDLDRALLAGATPFQGPFPLGHEAVAEVVEVGDDVTRVRPGDRVVVPFQISCGGCQRCQQGLTGSCTAVPTGAMYGLPVRGDWGGLLAETVHVPYADAMLLPLPDGVDAAALASASDNLPDAWRTVGPHLAARPGAPVAIVGGGAPSIGLYAVAIARALGAGQVDYVDADPERLRLAERIGATPIQGPAPKRLPRRYPITVDASAQPAGLACALRSTEPGGVCTSVGIYFAPETPVPLLEMFTTGLTFITGRPNVRVVIPEVLALVAAGRLHPEQVTSKVAAWDDAPTALVELPGLTKLVVAHETQDDR